MSSRCWNGSKLFYLLFFLFLLTWPPPCVVVVQEHCISICWNQHDDRPVRAKFKSYFRNRPRLRIVRLSFSIYSIKCFRFLNRQYRSTAKNAQRGVDVIFEDHSSITSFSYTSSPTQNNPCYSEKNGFTPTQTTFYQRLGKTFRKKQRWIFYNKCILLSFNAGCWGIFLALFTAYRNGKTA